MEKTKEQNTSFAGSIIKIALPVTLQSMLRSSFSMVDQVMIGQLGSESIAGIGLGGKFASMQSVILGAVTAAAAVMISQYMGQQNLKNVRRSFYANLLTALGVSLLFLLLGTVFAELIMSCYTEDMYSRQLAVQYLQVYSFIFLPAAISGIAQTMLCCMEAAAFSLCASIASLTINTGLNYLLIFGKFGFPALGVRGAAIGSVAAQSVSTLMTLGFLAWQLKRRGIRLSFEAGFDHAQRRAYGKILLPLLLCEFLWSLGENVYSGIYGHIGTQACAAMTMTAPIQGLTIGALCGLSQAAGILVGKSLGSQDYEKAYADAKKLMRGGLLGSLILSGLLLLFGKYYTEIYQVELAVKQMAYELLVVFAFVSPIKVQNMILGGGIIRSGGRTDYIMWIDIIGTWVFGVPCGLLAAFRLQLPVAWVYLLLSLEEGIRLAVSLIIFKKRIWMQKL